MSGSSAQCSTASGWVEIIRCTRLQTLSNQLENGERQENQCACR